MIRAALRTAGALLLAACGNVVPDEGTEPVALELNLGGSTGPAQLSECILSQATALLYFDGNLGRSAGDFSSRVQWSSSDPGVVAVSNGELPAASGGTYAAGVLLPHRSGVATITATYLDFRSTLELEVQPVIFALEPAMTDIAERSRQTFELRITTASGLSTVAPEGVQWSIDQAVSNASIDSGGLLSANDAGDGRFTLRGQAVGCDRSVAQSLKVSAIDRLELQREQPAGAPLPVGSSDLLRVLARFADSASPPQDLSTQVSFESDDDEVLGLSLIDGALKVSGLKAGSSSGLVRFEPTHGAALSVRMPDYTVAELDPTALRLSPGELRLSYPETGELTAWAIFGDGIERPVSRHVDWSSSKASAITVSAGGETHGVVSIGNVDYSGQAYAAFGGYTAAAAVLTYGNDGS